MLEFDSLLDELGVSLGVLVSLFSSPGMLLSVSRSDSLVSEFRSMLCGGSGACSSNLSSWYSSEVVAVSPGGALGLGYFWPVSVFSLVLLLVGSSVSLASLVWPCCRFGSFLWVQFCFSRSVVMVVLSFLALLRTISLAILARWTGSGCQLCYILGAQLGSLVSLILSAAMTSLYFSMVPSKLSLLKRSFPAFRIVSGSSACAALRGGGSTSSSSEPSLLES